MLSTDTQLTDLVANLKPGDPVPVPPEPPSESEIMAGWEGERDKPLLSIICHTYNHADFIKDALNGFLMQKTVFPFEIIIHDDASVDGTDKILMAYQSRYPHLIRLHIQEENQYQKGLKPLGFSFPLAKGKYIAFCEGDDYWIDDQKCLKQVALLESDPKVALVFADSIPFSDGKILGKDFGGCTTDLTQEELRRSPSIYTLTACFRNVLNFPIEGNFVGYGDLFMWSRLGEFGSGKYQQEVLPACYRVHAGGIHSMQDDRDTSFMLLKTYMAISAYYKRIGNPELEDVFLDKTLVTALNIMSVDRRLLPVMKLVTKVVYGLFRVVKT